MSTKEEQPVKPFLSLWIKLFIALELFGIVGVTIAGMQDITVMHPDQSGPSYLAALYVARNFVMCLGLALATYVFRSYIAFFIMLSGRILTEVADFTNSYLYERSPEILSTIPYLAVLMVIVPCVIVYLTWSDVLEEMRWISER